MNQATYLKLYKLRKWAGTIMEINSYQGQHVSIKQVIDHIVQELDKVLASGSSFPP